MDYSIAISLYSEGVGWEICHPGALFFIFFYKVKDENSNRSCNAVFSYSLFVKECNVAVFSCILPHVLFKECDIDSNSLNPIDKVY